MRVLARFPALRDRPADSRAVPDGSPPAATIQADDGAHAPPAAARRRPRTGPVAALAILAAIAWSMAAWNDSRRLARSRLERLAQGRTADAAPGTVAR